MSTLAFAVVENDQIIITTVSPTERAAKVNFLIAVRGVAIFDWMDDVAIDATWQQHARKAKIERVSVRRID